MSDGGAEESAGGGGGGHDAAGMMRWLLTYADMITLLMAFFIMVYSMSVINSEKFTRAAAGLRAEFGPRKLDLTVGGGPGLSPRRDLVESLQSSDLSEEVQWVEESLQDYIKEEDLGDVVRTERQFRGLTVSLVSDNVLFPVGEAELRPAALSLLDQIARLLKDIPNQIAVEGHTCNLPIETERFPSNWELSAARACSVVRYLIEQKGIPSSRLVATGLADSRPLASNATAEGRARNRRVDIIILSQGEVNSGVEQ